MMNDSAQTAARMRIAIDCDDTAVGLKEIILIHLNARNADVVDLNYLGTHPGTSYPEIGYDLARRIKEKEFDRGILLCGTGLGMAMIANKVESIYAGVCHDVYSAERLRKSNNAQIVTMGARVIGPELAKTVIDAWLAAEFQGGESASKVEMMHSLEEQSFHGNETVK